MKNDALLLLKEATSQSVPSRMKISHGDRSKMYSESVKSIRLEIRDVLAYFTEIVALV